MPPGKPETVTPGNAGDDLAPDREEAQDFGVEVRVVAASPGPVITRYEIEAGHRRERLRSSTSPGPGALAVAGVIRVVETIPARTT